MLEDKEKESECKTTAEKHKADDSASNGDGDVPKKKPMMMNFVKASDS